MESGSGYSQRGYRPPSPAHHHVRQAGFGTLAPGVEELLSVAAGLGEMGWVGPKGLKRGCRENPGRGV